MNIKRRKNNIYALSSEGMKKLKEKLRKKAAETVADEEKRRKFIEENFTIEKTNSGVVYKTK